MDFTLGHDAEVFLQNKKGEFIPAIGLINGTKTNPRIVKKGALQEDNVMAELNIDPATTKEEFDVNTNTVLKELAAIVRAEGLSIYKGTTAIFADKYIQDAQAKEFGCLPDYDAWDICENPIIDLQDTNVRYAAGHIHIGVPFYDDPNELCRFVRFLDNILGMGMLALYGITDRKKTYGRWGAHRPTPYGVEYRVPDNSWIFDAAARKWVFKVVEFTLRTIQHNNNPRYNKQTLIKYQGKKDTAKDIYSSICPVGLPLIPNRKKQ